MRILFYLLQFCFAVHAQSDLDNDNPRELQEYIKNKGDIREKAALIKYNLKHQKEEVVEKEKVDLDAWVVEEKDVRDRALEIELELKREQSEAQGRGGIPRDEGLGGASAGSSGTQMQAKTLDYRFENPEGELGSAESQGDYGFMSAPGSGVGEAGKAVEAVGERGEKGPRGDCTGMTIDECARKRALARLKELEGAGGDEAQGGGLNIGKAMYEAGSTQSVEERAAEIRAQLGKADPNEIDRDKVKLEEAQGLTIEQKAELIRKNINQETGASVKEEDPNSLQ